jgi:hypothetical protein
VFWDPDLPMDGYEIFCRFCIRPKNETPRKKVTWSQCDQIWRNFSVWPKILRIKQLIQRGDLHNIVPLCQIAILDNTIWTIYIGHIAHFFPKLSGHTVWSALV